MDLPRLLKEAQKMQNQLGKIEEELAATIYEGSAGGNGVKVSINGNYQIENIEIDAELLEKDNKEMIQDMIKIAVNDASKKAADDRQKKTGSVTSGVKVPGMF